MSGAYPKFFSHIDRSSVKTICELGSRDGLDAIKLQQHFDADVVAWECNPLSIPKCRSILEGHERIELVEKAVWSQTKEIKFHPVINGNIGASSAFKANTSYPYEQPYQQTTITVNAVRLDEWWKANRTKPIDLLVMDLQGGELEALAGIGDLIDDVQYIITEGQHKRLYHGTPLITDIEAFLKDEGFTLQMGFDVNDWFGDFLFIRE